jgi:hypothetical protein
MRSPRSSPAIGQAPGVRNQPGRICASPFDLIIEAWVRLVETVRGLQVRNQKETRGCDSCSIELAKRIWRIFAEVYGPSYVGEGQVREKFAWVNFEAPPGDQQR